MVLGLSSPLFIMIIIIIISSSSIFTFSTYFFPDTL